MQIHSETKQSEGIFNKKTLKVKLRHLKNKEIGNYSLKEKIAIGSNSKIYRAIHNPTGQNVAVKVYKKSKMTQDTLQKIIFQVQLQKNLFHPNIARVYELKQTENEIYVFVQYCLNGDILSYINKNDPLSQRKTCKILKQILSAMKYMKIQKIFHRNITCQNILFDQKGNSKLIGFGSATNSADYSFSREINLDTSYSAPQIYLKQVCHTQLIDIWSLGVILYFGLIGKFPFDGIDILSTKQNIKDIKYQKRQQLSASAQEFFSLIFTLDDNRTCIQDIQNTNFYNKYHFNKKINWININTDQFQVDLGILQVMYQEFQISQCQAIDSVTKFKIDPINAIYHLLVKRQSSKGKNIKGDIENCQFQIKQKKKVNTLKPLNPPIRYHSLKNMSLDKTLMSNNSRKFNPKLKIQKQKQLEILKSRRLNLPVAQIATRLRDNSPLSPKRILDLVSAYR